MAKDINLTSQQWNDIIFEGKNKEYGAYELRQSSSKRHVTALLSTLILAIFVAVIPALANKVKEWTKPTEGLNIDVNLVDLQLQKEAEQEKIIEEIAKPEELILNSEAYAPPDITEATNITDETQLRNMEDLSKSTNIISIRTITDGVEEGGIDIAKWEDHLKQSGLTKKDILDVDEVDVLPSFPGGDEELYRFLRDNLVYPPVDKTIGTEGTVMISFVVSKTGAITDVYAQKGPTRTLSAEAVRVAKKMPNWLPGKHNGKSVPVRFILPIEFKLN